MDKERPYRQALVNIQNARLRLTRQRLALAKLLFDGKDRHVTAEIIHREAEDSNVKISLATVYNALHQFTDAGLLREIVVDAGRSYFDTNISEHYHVFNEDSRQLSDIALDQVGLTGLPIISADQEIDRVDVIVRVKNKI